MMLYGLLQCEFRSLFRTLCFGVADIGGDEWDEDFGKLVLRC